MFPGCKGMTLQPSLLHSFHFQPSLYPSNFCSSNVSDIDECARANPCKEGNRCNNTFGSFTCECLPGYVKSETDGTCCMFCIIFCKNPAKGEGWMMNDKNLFWSFWFFLIVPILAQSGSLPVAAIAGIVVAVIFSFVLVAAGLYYKLRKRIELDKLPPDVAMHFQHYYDSHGHGEWRVKGEGEGWIVKSIGWRVKVKGERKN